LGETPEAVRDIIDDDKRAGAVILRMRSMLKRGNEKTQAVDLSAMVDETLRLLLNEARLRHVTLHHIATPDLPPVAADPTQLQQVILNLVTNGMEAAEIMPDQRQVEIRTCCTAGDGMQFLEVSDSGPGSPFSRRLNETNLSRRRRRVFAPNARTPPPYRRISKWFRFGLQMAF
jgi:C4-dicarboxylate-specific signal transduction histidine kinase